MWMKCINHISNYIGAVPVMISGIIAAAIAGLLSIGLAVTGDIHWVLAIVVCCLSYSVVMVIAFFLLFMLSD